MVSISNLGVEVGKCIFRYSRSMIGRVECVQNFNWPAGAV